LLKTFRPSLACPLAIKKNRLSHFGACFGVELDGLGVRQHLHFPERLESINAFGFAGINLFDAPPDLVPKCGIEPLRVFFFMDGREEMFVERQHILQWQLPNLLLNPYRYGCHTVLFYRFFPWNVKPAKRLAARLKPLTHTPCWFRGMGSVLKK
jgi:hypothetical protein